jgi:citrate synthase
MALDKSTVELIKAMPKDLHPMSKLSAGMLLEQKTSKFAAAYGKGVKKTELWEYMLEDALDLTAKTFTLAALIHNTHYSTGKGIDINSGVCLTDNFCQMIGKDDKGFSNLMKL